MKEEKKRELNASNFDFTELEGKLNLDFKLHHVNNLYCKGRLKRLNN